MSRARKVGVWVEGGTTHFRVWAPDRRKVKLALYHRPEGRKVYRTWAMKPEPGGYFHVARPRREVGWTVLYAYVLDGEGPYPDPASEHQPLGVHGPSMHDSQAGGEYVEWPGLTMDGQVLYEVHVGTATAEGSLVSLQERLGDLRSLGVTALSLMPVSQWAGARNWGYDGVYLRAAAASYDLQHESNGWLPSFVDEAHRHGLGVILDLVLNHVGPEGCYLGRYTDRYFRGGASTPWGPGFAVDGPDAAHVREFLLGSALHWMRGPMLDGLRLDATPAIHDTSREHLVAELARRVRKARERTGPVVLIAEDDRNAPWIVRGASKGGWGLDGIWVDDFYRQVRVLLTGEQDGFFADYRRSSEDLARLLQRGWLYEGQRSGYYGHARGEPAGDVPPRAVVHFLQNHDVVGNRARGDRLGAAVSPSAYRAASALLLLSPYTPMLFMGQEWNATSPFLYFTDHPKDLGERVAAGRRAEFARFVGFEGEVPDPQALATFERSKLDYSERERPGHAGVYALYRDLIALRAKHAALKNTARGSYEAWAVGPCAVALRRRDRRGGRELCVVVNLAGELRCRVEGARGRALVFDTEAPRYEGASPARWDAGRAALTLRGPGAVVLE